MSAEAQFELVLTLLRALICAFALVTLQGTGPDALVALLAGLCVASLCLVPLLAGLGSRAARRAGAVATIIDLGVFAAVSAAFPEASSASSYGVLALVAGPLRYGWRGTLLTGLPVGATAVLWPQTSGGQAASPVRTWLLVTLLVVVTAGLRQFVAHSSARLRLAEQQFAAAFEHASIGMALLDGDLRVLQGNRSLAGLLGVSAERLRGRSLIGALHPDERARAGEALASLGGERQSVRLEARLLRDDGTERWGFLAASRLTGSSGVAPRVVLQVENITDRKRTEDQLSHRAGHDPLTDLPNRGLLLSRLASELRGPAAVGVLFLDLDRFKVVNDGLGHAAGDRLLLDVATRLGGVVRPGDMVARLGGDEFVVLCRGADDAACAAVAERVLEALVQPFAVLGGAEVVVGASIGIAVASGGGGVSAETLLRDADTAMYAAKAAGGSRCRAFTSDLLDAFVRTHELEVDLRTAVRSGQLSVVYQPVIEVGTGLVISMEALARWAHPVRGDVSPTEFIGVAEQSDLVVALGDWVLDRALADITGPEWPTPDRDPSPAVSVNVSIRQLRTRGWAESVLVRLERSGLPPQRLCLEVTETALAGDVDEVVVALARLRVGGVKISIDDFGTGHASLTYLARFPIDQVKIDRSFVTALGTDARSAALVGGVVAMSHAFGLSVVAEGVERPAQMRALRELGCDAVQGHLLATPVRLGQLSVVRERLRTPSRLPVPRRMGSRSAGA